MVTRVSQFLMGGYLLVFLGLLKWENMQLEGFFFYLMSGFFGGSLIHYLVAKIGGPLLFNRGWCGWSCWTASKGALDTTFALNVANQELLKERVATHATDTT